MKGFRMIRSVLRGGASLVPDAVYDPQSLDPPMSEDELRVFVAKGWAVVEEVEEGGGKTEEKPRAVESEEKPEGEE